MLQTAVRVARCVGHSRHSASASCDAVIDLSDPCRPRRRPCEASSPSRGPPSSAPPLSLCPLQQPRCPARGLHHRERDGARGARREGARERGSNAATQQRRDGARASARGRRRGRRSARPRRQWPPPAMSTREREGARARGREGAREQGSEGARARREGARRD